MDVQTGLAFHASIAAAKGAVEAPVRSLGAEFAQKRIRFNAIALSLNETPWSRRCFRPRTSAPSWITG
ncbi:MAG: SDR family oxidoreductase [Spirochaetales bacterium]|nr:SDR family oxidoreductase [Spirochaetales bacterium]